MNLKEKIQASIKQALKDKKQQELDTLRILFAAIKNREIEKKIDQLNEMELLSLLQKQIKMIQETATQLVQAGRKEDAEKELTKVEVLKAYLPPAIDEDELKSIVSMVIESKKATSVKDQGLVIKEVQSRVKGGADNVLIVKLVREQLQ